ncbi:MAG: AMP-binding protein, partial [Steroidobacteraceae bacterium]
VPLAPLLGTSAIAAVIAQMRPRCCIFDEALRPEIESALARSGSTLIALRAQGRPPGALLYHDVLASRSTAALPREVADGHPALIVHTSGSEGRPKAITMSHGELRVFIEHNALLYEQFIEPDTAPEAAGPYVLVLPPSHLGGLGICLQGSFAARRICMLSYFVPETFLKLIEQQRVSLVSLVPSMYRSLLQDPYLQRADLTSLRFCITLGEPCSAELARQIETGLGATVVSAYGMTECLSGLGHKSADLFNGGVKHGSCGTHCFGEIKLLDENGNPHPDFGEMWVRNPTVHRCYPDPTLDSSRFRDGWFRTKDLFFRDRDGHFFHRGRCDDMFICNGKNVYPAEVERVLLEHPYVDTVVAAPVTRADSSLLVGVLVRVSQPTSESDIIHFCARCGQSHAIPGIVRFIEEFPQAGPGKLDRIASRRLLQDAYGARMSSIAPAGAAASSD